MSPGTMWRLDEVKTQLKEMVEMPMERGDSFKRMGIRPAKGILLYGPPGTGKTLLAKAVATESKANFISIKGPEIMNKWVGESEKAIRQAFKKAKQVANSIVFLDDIRARSPQGVVAAPRTGSPNGSVNQLLT